MKRFKISIVIILLLVVVVTFGHIFVQNYLSNMLSSLDNIKFNVQNKDFNKAQKEINSMLKYTKQKEFCLAIFVKRDYLSNISSSISTLKAYAIPNQEPDLFAELDRAVSQMETVKHLFFSIF